MADTEWQLPYTPRPYMLPFHARTNRFSFLICHRRAGKTVATVAELVIRALYTKKKHAQYFYICPFRSQAKSVAWQYLVDMTEGVATDVKVSELSVKLPNGAKIFLSGSDNVNALRGLYADGVVLDEFAQCRPDLLQAVVMPLLLDRKGWMVIIGTAYGRMNQFYEYYEKSRTDPTWFHMDLKVYDSNIIPEEEVERIRGSVSAPKFNQEFLNDFSAELVGTYFAALISKIEQEGRINPKVTHDTALKTYAAFDIGRGDSTVIWFWQEKSDGIYIIDHYANNGEQAKHYIDYLNTLPYDFHTVWLPHDAKAETFATNKSALEQFVDAFTGTPTHVRIVPRLSVEDGIEAARITLPSCYINAETCYEGVECLRVYRKRWDELNQCFAKTPMHDFASDHADSFRYLAIVANKNIKKAPSALGHVNTTLTGLSDYNLDKLYKEREKNAPRRIQKLRI